MAFGDVLDDGLVICSLHCSVEHGPVHWEPGDHTTVAFALMWSIYPLRCQLTLSCPQLTLQLNSRDYMANWGRGGVTFNFSSTSWEAIVATYYLKQAYPGFGYHLKTQKKRSELPRLNSQIHVKDFYGL